MTNRPSKFAYYKDLVNSYLASYLSSGDGTSRPEPYSLYDPIHYALEGNGKRIRPVLLLLCCYAAGGSVQQALPAAAAVELMHNFTLVHDDIMDRDDTRRGRPTVHRQWNTDVAILAGDGLVVLAYRSLLRTVSPVLAEICRVFTDGLLEICEGQALDRDFEQDDGVTMARYETMILKKTARLLSVCTQIGAMLGNASPRQIELYRNFGEHLGLAFQIQDDLLDITIEEEILGKDFGSDVRRRKKTFLYIHAMENGKPEHCDALRKIFSKPVVDRADIFAAQRIFRACGAMAAAGRAVDEHIRNADHNLTQLAPSADVTELAELVQMILRRKT